MKTIAEQIYDAINRTEAVATGDSYPDQRWCEKIAKDCIENKKSLIEILSKHPNWDAENYRVHFNKDFVRTSDKNSAKYHLRKAMDCLTEYVYTDILRFCLDYTAEREQLIKLRFVTGFIYDWASDFVENFISEDIERILKSATEERNCFSDEITRRYTYEDAHIHAGTKSTKQVMKLMRQYGFDLLPEDIQHSFLQEYSQYADCMNPITITRHTVLSVNPVDFLYMSVGNSWTSCHNILEGGCYCGGCESYAYDTVSMIFYTVDADTPDDKITTAPKINRQMNFYNGDALLSVRVYPQSCDDDHSFYDECKAVVQQILADCNERPNLWKETKWTETSYGHQYPDYRHFGPYKSYRLSDVPLKERRSWIEMIPDIDIDTGEIKDYTSKFIIGSDDAICACCGNLLDNESSPICDDCTGSGCYGTCESCGDRIYNDYEAYWVHDTLLCEDCFDDQAIWCEQCGENEWQDNSTWIESEGRYVCDDCLREYYSQCVECEEWFRTEDMTETADGDYVCDSCYADYYYTCDECGAVVKFDDTEEIGGDSCYRVCHDCLDDEEKFGQCEECGDWFKREDGKETEDGFVCDSCVDRYYELKYVRKENA